MNAIHDYFGLINEIRKSGHEIIRNFESKEAVHSECSSLLPLALALAEVANLLAIFQPATKEATHIKDLFDGGEENGPNIDTRLRCIRDLCSASVYPLRKRASSIPFLSPNSSLAPPKTPDEREWLILIAGHTMASASEESVAEVARLLDDIFEAALRIAQNFLGLPPPPPRPSWNELTRQVAHIRDHFDYAEKMILECIRPSLD